MECTVCAKSNVEFQGRRHVCSECIPLLIQSSNEKQCEYCGLVKQKVQFSKTKKGTVCKECKGDHTRDLKQNYHQAHYKAYYDANKERMIEKSIRWNVANPEKRALVKKNYRNNHKDELDFRIKENLNTRLRNLVKKEHNKFVDFIGCDLEFLKKWLEFNFTADMTWDNYGKFWHIDHVTPCASFKNLDVNKDDQFKCWNWKNLRPLEARENAKKGFKVDNNIAKEMERRGNLFIEYMEKVQRA